VSDWSGRDEQGGKEGVHVEAAGGVFHRQPNDVIVSVGNAGASDRTTGSRFDVVEGIS